MEEQRHSTFAASSSCAERPQNEYARFSSLEEGIGTTEYGIEEIQERTYDHQNRGNGTIHPCAGEEVTSKNASDRYVDEQVSPRLFWLSFLPLQVQSVLWLSLI